jgi:hypothetical protein
MDDARPRRVPGQGRGQWIIRKDFDDPLPQDQLEGFEGGAVHALEPGDADE